MLFILAIVDTIEPYKLYGSRSSKQNAIRIWKSFDISFADNALTVSARYKCRSIRKIYESAQRLKSWVDIEDVVLGGDGESFSIKFKTVES